MSISFNGCYFGGNSTGIKNHYEISLESADLGRIESELGAIKKTLEKASPEYQAVEKLETAAKNRDRKSFAAYIGEFAGQFTSGALANLAGAYLSTLLQLG